jgi:hypothetical protein
MHATPQAPLHRHTNCHTNRHVYSPKPDRLPRWVWRVWGWF